MVKFDKDFGAAVCERRNKLMLSRGELAARVGLAESTIGRIEDNQHAPHADTRRRLVEFFREVGMP